MLNLGSGKNGRYVMYLKHATLFTLFVLAYFYVAFLGSAFLIHSFTFINYFIVFCLTFIPYLLLLGVFGMLPDTVWVRRSLYVILVFFVLVIVIKISSTSLDNLWSGIDAVFINR